MIGEAPLQLTVSDAVALINQTLDYAYPSITIIGELSSFQVSKGKWVYGDIKDDNSKLRLFGTVYQLQTPLEDGMMIEIVARPSLHPQYGFSLQLQSIKPVGEGSLKKSALMLEGKLAAEGLFALERKRTVPYPPQSIGLIASSESAAYADFIKITSARWPLAQIVHYDVAVQGSESVESIVRAIAYFSEQDISDTVVLIRGGGSSDDLAAFSTETVTRAVAASRIPTVVAIGHETDVSLAEKAADLAASTPSNAAELLYPDFKDVLSSMRTTKKQLSSLLTATLKSQDAMLSTMQYRLREASMQWLARQRELLAKQVALLRATHPKNTLARGYIFATDLNDQIIRSALQTQPSQLLKLHFHDGEVETTVNKEKK